MESSSCIDSSSTIELSSPPLQRMGSGVSAVTSPAAMVSTEPGTEAESKKLPSSKYKGVVPQPNGRWGSQIYEKHRRVWLGTFNLEHDAARAYDLAAQRFRGRDAITNFPPLSILTDANELAFLLSRSKSEVVDMLRKHTYVDELRHSPPLSSSAHHPTIISTKPAREHLFDKAVTPSDVGKLNRLVIPKQHAEKHFPLQDGVNGVLLNFEEGGAGGKVWRFRYSYWNSSQSYVLTKGWSRFVREKGLVAGDSVGFYRSKSEERQLYIDCRPSGGGEAGRVQILRLFGVNIVKSLPANLTGSSLHQNGKRSLESIEAGLLKKQCVGAL